MIYQPPIAFLLSAIASLGTTNSTYDVNYDGVVTIKDILIILAAMF